MRDKIKSLSSSVNDHSGGKLKQLSNNQQLRPMLGGDLRAAKEDVRRSSMKSEKSIQRGGRELTAGLNKHRTLIQETAVHVQCETRIRR